MTSISQLDREQKQEEKFQILTKIIPNDLKLKEEQFFELFLKNKGNPLTKLKLIYSFMDQIFKPIYKMTPCKKGCSDCCRIPVSISAIEIDYIKSLTNLKPKKLIKSNKNTVSTPCPLLKNGVCSIYEYRPFVCRQFITLYDTAEFCHPSLIYNECLLFGFTEIQKAYNYLIKNTSNYEIRDVFS